MINSLIRTTLVICFSAIAGCAAAQSSEWKAFSTPGGQVPAALKLTSLAGKHIDLGVYKGEVVLVNFWATWCEPCRDEMPSLNRFQHQLQGKQFRVLGVNVGEGKQRIQQFLKLVPVDFTIVRDADSDVMKAWRVRVFPASFLIDKNGMLRYQLEGEANWDDARLQAPILELLKY